MSGDILAIILITIALTSALLVINLRSWRGHRVYLLSTALGLSILSFSSGEKTFFLSFSMHIAYNVASFKIQKLESLF